jgi:hypothetical protein
MTRRAGSSERSQKDHSDAHPLGNMNKTILMCFIQRDSQVFMVNGGRERSFAVVCTARTLQELKRKKPRMRAGLLKGKVAIGPYNGTRVHISYSSFV